MMETRTQEVLRRVNPVPEPDAVVDPTVRASTLGHVLGSASDCPTIGASRRWRRRRPMLLGGSAAGLAAIAAGVVLALTATNATPPAFALTDNHDGTFTLTVSQAGDRAAINDKLAQDGIRARLVPLRQGCSTPLNMPWRYLQPSTQPWATKGNTNGPAGSWSVGIIPSRIPAGHTLVFTLQEWHHRGWESASEIFKSPGPRCAAPQGSGFTIFYR